MDSNLLELKRVCAESPEDEVALYKYRLACLRDGKADLAGLHVGDEVLITEVESPWSKHPFRAEILRLFEAGDANVKPLDEISYRVQPSPEDLAKGLYLTRVDKKVLLSPALPK